MYVEVGNDPVALINLDGEFFALHDLCTHEDASLSDGEVIGDEIECPMHGGAFEIRTGIAGKFPCRGAGGNICDQGRRRYRVRRQAT